MKPLRVGPVSLDLAWLVLMIALSVLSFRESIRVHSEEQNSRNDEPTFFA